MYEETFDPNSKETHKIKKKKDRIIQNLILVL
jgi:hypothetical protein